MGEAAILRIVNVWIEEMSRLAAGNGRLEYRRNIAVGNLYVSL
jgi:hypothetical protein